MLILKSKFIYILFAVVFLLGDCVELNRKLIGLKFYPYVRKPYGIVPDKQTYTFQNIKTMLKLVATKFSSVMLYTLGRDNVDGNFSNLMNKCLMSTLGFAPYLISILDAGNNGDIEIITNTFNAAAVINQEQNAHALSVFFNMHIGNHNQAYNVALEAVQEANSKYPGTVEGILLTKADFVSDMYHVINTNEFLNWIKLIRSRSSKFDIKIGIRVNCDDLINFNAYNENSLQIWAQAIKESDFVVCRINVALHETNVTHWVKLRGYQNLLTTINHGVEVMLELNWWPHYSGKDDNAIVQKYLKGFDKQLEDASRNANLFNLRVWLDLGFHLPSYVRTLQLANNDSTNTPEGYIEKTSEKPVNISRSKETTTTTVSPPTTTVLPATKTVSTATSPFTTLNTRTLDDVNDEGLGTLEIFGIAIGLILVVLVPVACVVIALKRKKFFHRNILARREVHEFKHGMGDDEHTPCLICDQRVNIQALKLAYDESLEIPKENLEIRWDQVIGGGVYGSGYKAILKNSVDKEVALKMLKHEKASKALKDFLCEIKILTYLSQHRNIVTIRGAYTAEIQTGVVYIATELCQLGSLQKYLVNIKNKVGADKDIPYKDMIRWTHQIACGMEYLGQKDIIHADLASKNVLLSTDKIAKITGFGMSRGLHSEQAIGPLSWRSMAVETLKKIEYSVQSDVWAYGVTLWEIYSLGDIPFSEISWSQDFIKSLETGLRLNKPQYVGSGLFKIMKDCWQHRPEDRPTFTQLKDLTRIANHYPPRLKTSTSHSIDLGPNMAEAGIVVGTSSLEMSDLAKEIRKSKSFAILVQKWKVFGNSLGIDDVKLLDLDSKQKKGDVELEVIPREILKIWKAQEGSKATLGVLYESLVECGVRDIAESVLEKFCNPDFMQTTTL